MDRLELKGKIKDRVHNFDDIFPTDSTRFDNMADEAISEYSRYKPFIRETSLVYVSDKEKYSLPNDCQGVFDLYYLSDDKRFYPDFRKENQSVIILDDIYEDTNIKVKYYSEYDEVDLNHADKSLKEYILYEIYDFLADNAAQIPSFDMGDQSSNNYKMYKALSKKAKEHEERFESLVLSQEEETTSMVVNQSIQDDGELLDAIQDDNLGL